MDRRIRIQYGETINTGNYESKRLDLAIETDIKDSDDLDKELEWLHNQLKLNYEKLKNS